MEAKVDVRKLQILNDRINQTIDALNQVRLSVHGLGHTGLSQGMNPFTQGLGQQSFGQFGQQPFGVQQPFGFQQSMGIPSPYGIPQQFGFQHNPYQQYLNPFTNPLFTQGQSSPWGQVGSPWGYNQGAGGLGSLYGGGLSHSSPELKYMERQLAEVRANNPFRIAQTFPFVVS
jgi:hypothetical protein